MGPCVCLTMEHLSVADFTTLPENVGPDNGFRVTPEAVAAHPDVVVTAVCYALDRDLREDPLRYGSGDLLQRKRKDHAGRQFVDLPTGVWLQGPTVLLLAGVRDALRQIVEVNNLGYPFDDNQ